MAGAEILSLVVVPIVCSIITLIGVIISNVFTNSKTLYRVEQLEKSNGELSNLSKNLVAVKTDIELIKLTQSNLTTEVRKHNNVIERMYEVEKNIAVIKENQEGTCRRLEDVEKVVFEPSGT